MTSFARRERLALADLAEQLGPDAPTLCGDWTTRQLLAHLVVRESSLLGAPGIAISPLSGLTDREMARVGARNYADLAQRVRRPSRWSPSSITAVDAAANGVELFVHHEDIRRAGSDWVPRELSGEDQDALWKPLRTMGRLMVRKAGVGVTVRRTDTDETAILVKGDGVELAGLPSELLLVCFGRERADVSWSGDPAAIATFKAADKGM